MNTSKARVFVFLLLLLTLFLIPFNYLESLPDFCVFKNIIIPEIFSGDCPTEGFFKDCSCPACGITRGIASLLHLDFKKAVAYNILSIPILILILILFCRDFYKIYFKKFSQENN